MKMFAAVLILAAFIVGSFAFGDAHVRAHGHGGGLGHGQGNGDGGFVFPKYPAAPRTGPGPARGPHGPAPVEHVEHGPRVPSHPDALGNHVTEDHLSRVEFAHGRAENIMKKDPRVTTDVSRGRAHFVNNYRPEFEHKRVVINDYVTHYNTIVVSHPVYVDVWRRHYFHSGFYWGFHPILDIDDYFYNPMVYWFFVPTYDEYYYRTWYQTRFDAYPELHRPFEYHGVYYPTENLRQLLFGVSAMPAEKQARFRAAIEVFTRRLAQNMANGLGTHVRLSNGDIAVTHYEIIGYDDAVQLDGFVTFRGEAYNFKGLVNIEEPDHTDVFVPATWDKKPNDEQLSRLDALNAKIASIKGEPAPEPMSAEPESAGGNVGPGEVSAEPQK